MNQQYTNLHYIYPVRYNEVNYDFIKNFHNSNWNFKMLSKHQNFSIEWIEIYPDADWNFKQITKSNNFNLSWLDKYPHAKWDFYEISCNPCLKLKLLKKFSNAEWDFQAISLHNKYITLDWLETFPNSDWNFRCFTKRFNPSLTLEWISKFPDAFWDINELCKSFNSLEVQYKLRDRCILAFIPERIKQNINFIMPFIFLNNNNLRYIDEDIKNQDVIKNISNHILTEIEIDNMMKIVNANYSIEKYFPEMFYNIDEPLILQNLSGDIFTIENWFKTNMNVFGVKKLIYQIYDDFPELEGCDFFIEDKLAKNISDKEFKQLLLECKEGVEAMVVYMEQEE
jgi:hypothetical protein